MGDMADDAFDRAMEQEGEVLDLLLLSDAALVQRAEYLGLRADIVKSICQQSKRGRRLSDKQRYVLASRIWENDEYGDGWDAIDIAASRR